MEDKNGHYIIEFYQVGNSIKVSAIDPSTMEEVSIIGSPKTSKEVLKKIAVKKLEYVLAKKEK